MPTSVSTDGAQAHLPKQPDPVLKQMFHMYLLLPVVFWVAAIITIRFYPLTRIKAAAIRSELEARRGFI